MTRTIHKLGGSKTGAPLEEGAPFVALGGIRWGDAWLQVGDVVPTDGVSAAGIHNAVQAGYIAQVIVPNGHKLVRAKGSA